MSYNPKISILIPSTKEKIYDIVDHIESISTCSYEIIVCTPLDINFKQSNVKVIQDDEDNIGSISPINRCFKEAQCDYFFVTCDDILIHKNCFNIEEFTKSNLSSNKYKICSIGYKDAHGATVPTFGGYERINNVRILSFPAGSTQSVYDHLDGVIFNGSFKHIYADNWLSYYINYHGKKPVFMPNTENDLSQDIRDPRSASVRSYDEKIFKEVMNVFDSNKNIEYNYIVD
tara:strand:- start:248 stop:940 length:693 start_codon:yes stop_codon:yes gene_type:complete